VPPNEQGQLQGSVTSLMSATSIIGPLLMTNLFYYFTQKDSPMHFPGAPFLLGSVLILLSCLIAFRSLRRKY
jgi:DHA1 family tetracycline resistance protein-like MFS transporter